MTITQLLGRKCRKAAGNNSREYRVVGAFGVNTMELVIEDVQTGALTFTTIDKIRMEPQP